MTRTEIDTILDIAYERAILIKQKHEIGKEKIIDDAIKDLKKAEVEKSTIAKILVKKLANKDANMSRATIYRRVRAEFKSKTRGLGRKGKEKESLSHVRQTQTQSLPPVTFPPAITVAVTSEGSYPQTTHTITEPEPEPEKSKTKWPEQDAMLALKISSDRNNVVNGLIYDISGMDETERREFARKLAKGKTFTYSLAEYCNDHIFDLVARIPDIQIELSLSLSQTLVALLQKYTEQLYQRRLKMKSGLESV